MTTQYILQCILLLVQLYLSVWNKTVSQSVFTHFSHMLLLGALQNLSYQVFRGSSPSSSPSLTQCSPSGFSWVQLSGSWSAQKDKLLDEGRKEMITLTSKQHIVNGKKCLWQSNLVFSGEPSNHNHLPSSTASVRPIQNMSSKFSIFPFNLVLRKIWKGDVWVLLI